MLTDSVFETDEFRVMQASRLGFLVQILFRTSRDAVRSARHLWPAIRHQQIFFAFSKTGAPIGYVIWAFLSDELFDSFRRGNGRPLHISEWNEGDRFWIIDLAATEGGTRTISALKKKIMSLPISEINGRRPGNEKGRHSSIKLRGR